jgi:hypothetical protein
MLDHNEGDPAPYSAPAWEPAFSRRPMSELAIPDQAVDGTQSTGVSKNSSRLSETTRQRSRNRQSSWRPVVASAECAIASEGVKRKRKRKKKEKEKEDQGEGEKQTQQLSEDIPSSKAVTSVESAIASDGVGEKRGRRKRKKRKKKEEEEEEGGEEEQPQQLSENIPSSKVVAVLGGDIVDATREAGEKKQKKKKKKRSASQVEHRRLNQWRKRRCKRGTDPRKTCLKTRIVRSCGHEYLKTCPHCDALWEDGIAGKCPLRERFNVTGEYPQDYRDSPCSVYPDYEHVRQSSSDVKGAHRVPWEVSYDWDTFDNRDAFDGWDSSDDWDAFDYWESSGDWDPVDDWDPSDDWITTFGRARDLRTRCFVT